MAQGHICLCDLTQQTLVPGEGWRREVTNVPGWTFSVRQGALKGMGHMQLEKHSSFSLRRKNRINRHAP